MKPTKRYKWILGLLVIFGVGLSLKYFREYNLQKKSEVEVGLGTVVRTDLVRRVMISGQISPKRTTGIAPPFAGYVHKLYVKVGDSVRAGDPLISVSQLPNGGGQSVFPIPAPFSGKIVIIANNEGEQVDPSGQNQKNRGGMLRIDDVSAFFVDADVAEIDYPNIKIGLSALVALTSSPQNKYKGQITSIAAAPRGTDGWDRNRVEYPIRINIESPDKSMISGMSAIVEVITSERKDALVVKHQFVTHKNNKYMVQRADGKESEIKIGLQTEEYFEVLSGLAEGDRVRLADFSAPL